MKGHHACSSLAFAISGGKIAIVLEVLFCLADADGFASVGCVVSPIAGVAAAGWLTSGDIGAVMLRGEEAVILAKIVMVVTVTMTGSFCLTRGLLCKTSCNAVHAYTPASAASLRREAGNIDLVANSGGIAYITSDDICKG